MAALPSPQPMAVGETDATQPTYASTINENQQSSEKSLKPVTLLHGEPTVIFDSKDLESFIREENLQYALIAKFSHGRPELPDLRKILPQQLGFKGECNIGLLESRHVLLRFTLKEDYIAIFSKTSRSIKFAGTVISFRIQKWTPSFNPREETSIAMAWISFPSLPCQYFARNALFSMASAVGRPLDVDRATYDKTRPSTARVKVEVDLLRTLPKRIRVQFKDLVTGEITSVWQKVRYDYLPYYCKRCKHQGHRETDCRTLIDCQVDISVNEDHIEGEKFEGDLRDHLNAKKADLNRLKIDEKADNGVVKNLDVGADKSEVQEHDLVRQNEENSGQHMGNAVWQDYISDAIVGDNEQLVMDTNQQTDLSKDAQCADKSKELQENEVVYDIAKDSSMRQGNAHPEILAIDVHEGQEKTATSKCGDLVVQSNVSKGIVCTNPFEALREEKELELVDSNIAQDQTLVQGDSNNNLQLASPAMATLNTSAQEVSSQSLDSLGEHQGQSADLGNEEEQVLPTLLNSKLSPKAPEFVPKSVTAKKIESVALVSGGSLTNDCAIDLFDNFSNEDEEDMLDRCFDEVAREGDISPRHQRSGTNKIKKKTHGKQHSWDGKVTEEFVPRHLPMRLAKRNHLTVSLGSNNSKRK